MHILRARDRVAIPWKNGAGTTREIAKGPPGADSNTFAWRISLATLDADAPFSPFPGIDRTFMIAGGPGITLTVDDHPPMALLPFQPFAFRGESTVACRLHGAPAVALNVMTRRSDTTAALELLRLEPGTPVQLVHEEQASVLVVLLRGTLVVGGTLLRPLDAALLSSAFGDGGPAVTSEAGSAVAVVRIVN